MKERIDDKLIEQLMKNYERPEDLIGPKGLIKQLKKRLIEKAMQAELTTQLGYEKHQRAAAKEAANAEAAKEKAAKQQSNSRNGHSTKTVLTGDTQLEIEVPRDRKGEYEPVLIPRHCRRFDGFDEVILSLYSRGMTTRDIQEHLRELYQVEISPTLISNVTASVQEDIVEWQNRPLDEVYPILFFDAIQVKVRQEGKVSNRAIYVALAITMEGTKEVLGLWSGENEGARFWLGVFNELHNRGIKDILICSVDGLTGMVEAIHAVYPKARVQLCIVHVIRQSLKYVSWKDRKAVVSELKNIYKAPTEQAGKRALEEFARKYDSSYPMISKIWQRHWENIIVFYAWPEEIRRVIYTTNAIESLNSSLRKISRNRRVFPSQEAVFKLFYLSLKNIAGKWSRPIHNWANALNQFMIEFSDRLTKK